MCRFFIVLYFLFSFNLFAQKNKSFDIINTGVNMTVAILAVDSFIELGDTIVALYKIDDVPYLDSTPYGQSDQFGVAGLTVWKGERLAIALWGNDSTSDTKDGFLNNELKLINLKPIKNQVLDTVTLARKKLNSRIANLDYLCKRFSIDASARTLHGALLDCHLLAEVYLELMGRKQTSLELSEHKSNKKQKEDKNLKKRQKILKISITDEQINLHKKHVRTIKDNLWEKLRTVAVSPLS